MKKYLGPLLSIALFSTVIFISCKKKDAAVEEAVPVAKYSSDKAEYTEGETMTLSNQSENAKTYRWTLPDGATANSSDLVYAIPRTGQDLKAQFKLEAIAKSGLKSDYVVKTITIKAAKGKLVLYWGYSSTYLTVYIDGKNMGTFTFPVTQWPNSTEIPSCGQNGYPTFELTAGSHAILVTGSGSQWTKNIDVHENDCTVLGVYQ